MEKLQVGQLTVIIVPPATSFAPVDGRKYSLGLTKAGNAHVLSIGASCDIDEDSSEQKDKLVLEWKPKMGEYVLTGKININEKKWDVERANELYQQWQYEIPYLLSLIVKADYSLFQHVPWLLDAPILIECFSEYPQSHSVKKFGTPRKYLSA